MHVALGCRPLAGVQSFGDGSNAVKAEPLSPDVWPAWMRDTNGLRNAMLAGHLPRAAHLLTVSVFTSADRCKRNG